MDIYIVYEEFQRDTPSVHAAFASEVEADAFAAALRLARHRQGRVVFPREPPSEDEWPGGVHDDANWEVDIRVDLVELHGVAIPSPAVGALHATPSQPPSLDWNECNPGRLKAVGRIEGLLVHLEALRVLDQQGVQAVDTDGLTPEDAACNSEIYEGLQQVQEGRYATTTLPGRNGRWVCFAVPFTE